MKMEWETDNGDVKLYYAKRGKMLQIALFGLLFILVGVYLVTLGFGPGVEHSIYTGIVGVLSLLLGAAGLVIGLLNSLRRPPALILDRYGLTDQSSVFGAGFIAWSDISEIATYTLKNQPFVCMELYDPQSFIQRQSWIKQRLIRANQALVPDTVNIALRGFGSEADPIFYQIQEYWQRFGRLEG
ncbi:hypothetical protein B9G55_18010 [Saccharibacillus sp. O16]|nr:hypothetical protein B9G55_18010 [Saccharibacillus sp. O16]